LDSLLSRRATGRRRLTSTGGLNGYQKD
jgi:integrase